MAVSVGRGIGWHIVDGAAHGADVHHVSRASVQQFGQGGADSRVQVIEQTRVRARLLLTGVPCASSQRHCRVGHQFGVLTDGARQAGERLQRSAGGAGVVAGDDDGGVGEGLVATSEVEESGDSPRRDLHELTPAAQEVARVVHRVSKARAGYDGRGSGFEVEGGDDADRGASTAQRPRQLGVLVLRSAHHSAVGGDHFRRAHVVDGQPVEASHQSDAAGGGQPTDADVTGVARADGQSPWERGAGHLPPARAGTDAHHTSAAAG